MKIRMKRLDIVVVVLVLVFLASGIIENPVSRIARSVVDDIQKAWTTPTIQPQQDMPSRTQDEVCALVYNYLETKISSVSAIPYRMDLLDQLDKARPQFQAVYQGNGKWQVSAIGYGVQIDLEEYKKNFSSIETQKVEAASPAEREQWVKLHEQWFLSNPSSVKTGVHRVYYYRGGLWNLYEVSGAIEPANEQASELLFYIQWFTR